MYRNLCIFALLTALLLPTLAAADKRVLGENAAGVPNFVTGELGMIDSAAGLHLKGKDEALFGLSAKNTMLVILQDHFGAVGSEDVEVLRVRRDRLGKVHVRFQQHLNGLPVVGADMYLHADAETGRVYAVNGDFAPDLGVPYLAMLKGSAADFTDRLAKIGVAGDPVSAPELLYFFDAETGVTHLSWKVRVQGLENGLFFDNDVYVDALHHKIVAVDANIHTAKNRNTYDATGSVVGSTSITGLPGTLVCNESNSNCNDASAQRAHDGSGDVYDYYQTRFGRDSLNNSGMTLVSSVHVGSNWANAAWYNNQMIYGDGDGSSLDDLTKSFDVIAHELTHGVTDFESDLIYQKESGALNEAWSDIFGVSADAYSRGVIDAATWKLGEEVYTPGTSGDALRYMNDPDLDGYSKGYYPERLYSGSCTPSSSNDQCGVHGNSGIANLAYYLLVQGGTHPRGKTSVNVPAIGMTKAEQIFYRAQTSCLTSSSNFEAARNCTAQAATDLYGSTENAAVHDAWDAVGVPGGGGSGGGELSNGVAETGLSGSAGSDVFYTVAIPSGATDLSVQLSGGTGDADLYVRFGTAPTTSTYDCRSWNSSNNETCSFASPSTGTYHVMVHAYATYSGASLTASWTVPNPNVAPSASFTSSTSDLTADFTDTSTDSDGTIASWSWNFGDGGSSTSQNPSHAYASAGSYTVTLTVTDDDGATDDASASVTVTDPPSGGNELANGVPVTGLSGSTGNQQFFTIEIPAGASDLTFNLSGGSGDADLYVRFGSAPTTSTYDCRSWNSGNTESCTFASPSAGTYHVLIHAYSTYSGASLTASFTEPGGSCGASGSANNLSASTGQQLAYTFDTDACASTLTISISGGTGDADLHVRFGSAPTTSTYDCRPYKNGNNETCTFTPPQAGTYHIMIRAYSAFSGVDLTASYE